MTGFDFCCFCAGVCLADFLALSVLEGVFCVFLLLLWDGVCC